MRLGERCLVLLPACLVLVLRATGGHADDVRYYESNGITYRESRRVVRRPVTEVVHQPVDRTIYREQYKTEYQDTVRVYSVPVTEYRWEAYWRGRWNPFVQPYLDQRLVPYTRWETRTEKVQVPVVRRELIPEVRQEHVPIVTQRYVDDEYITRTAVATRPPTSPVSGAPAQIAQRPQLGGSGPDPASQRPAEDDWRPSQGATLR
jgi:hypothetical protein